MKFHLLALVLVVAAVVAGCGGGGGTASLANDDVAVVGQQHVTKARFNDVMHQEALSLKSQGVKMPKAGTSDYTSVKTQVMAALVQQAEFDEQADKLGVLPTAKDVDKELTQLKKQYFGGDEKQYKASLQQQGYTDAEVRDQLRVQLTANNLFKKVTADVKPTAKEIQDYYAAHLSDYVKETRAVEEILVGKNKKALATEIYNEIKAGKSFAKLAKQYSQDPGSKDKGGKYTATKGQDVAQFDAAVFATSAKTGQLLKPVNTSEYGWFVIRPTGAIKSKTTTENQARAEITKALKTDDRNTAMNKWVTGISKTYCKGQITYQAGYKPNPDPCAAATTTAPTTT